MSLTESIYIRLARRSTCQHLRTNFTCTRRVRIHLPSTSRTYATHKGAAAASATPLLSQALDQKARSARRDDSVGPFQLGLMPPASQDVGNIKKWSELNTAEKVVRTTARTSNLVVILFGAGLSAVLVYALTSEMFSKNSPTVLYGQACDMIKASPKISPVLQGPLTFHNNPPSTGIRPRHRNHHMASQIYVDQTGREHMRLHFFVQGREPGSADSNTDGYFDRAITWAQQSASSISEQTFDEIVDGVKSRANGVVDSCRGIFRFLSGEPSPSHQSPTTPLLEHVDEPKPKGWLSNVTGMFSGIKSTSSSSSEPSLSHNGPMATEGEVHADLVMNDQGYFKFRHLLVDIPDSQSPSHRRVFIIGSGNDRTMRRHK